MKQQSIKIAYLVNLDLDRVVERHITQVCYHTEVDYTTVTCTGESNPEFITVKAYPKPSVAIIKQKYMFLLHIIITRCLESNKNKCTLNSLFFTHHIFHDQFTPMIYNLCQMGIISCGAYSAGTYSVVSNVKVKKEATPYYLMDWSIDYAESTNVRLIKWSKELAKHNKVNKKKYKRSAFTDNYNKSLTEVRLIDRDGALLYIDNNFNKDTHEYHYNMRFIDNIDQVNRGIYNIDDQGRIYHILTSLPKVLRPYYNIKYEFDIANSHPMLFNQLLIQYYNINKGVLNILDNIINNNNTINNNNKYHYDSEYIRNQLKNNNIQDHIFDDVLEYMVKTMLGKFYEDFCEIFHDQDRSEVKTKLFQHVFYSHLQANNRYSTKYLKAFKQKYPHVWRVIYDSKVTTDDKLPHKMMSLESSLFRPILKECWKRGWKAVNIHDALVLLDCKDNEGVTADDVKEIIQKHYHKMNLYPTIKAEIGGDAS